LYDGCSVVKLGNNFIFVLGVVQMFGSKRKKVTAHTIAALQPLVGIFQINYGIPPDFWNNEFALGFLSFCLAFHRDKTSGIRLSDADRGLVMYDVFSSLSNLNGQSIGRRVTELASSSPKSTGFESGADNAAIFVSYSLGILKNAESNPHVIEARTIAAAANFKVPGGVIAILGTNLFLKPVAMQLGLL
jgi:hypothetical protein